MYCGPESRGWRPLARQTRSPVLKHVLKCHLNFACAQSWHESISAEFRTRVIVGPVHK